MYQIIPVSPLFTLMTLLVTVQSINGHAFEEMKTRNAGDIMATLGGRGQ